MSIYAARFKCHGFINKVGLACFSNRVTVVVDKFKRCKEDVVDGVAKIFTDPGLHKIRHSSLVCRCGFAFSSSFYTT